MIKVDAEISSTVLETSKELALVAPQLDALCERVGAICFNHSSFFLPWARAATRKGKLACIALWRGERMVGFAPFFKFTDKKALFGKRIRFPVNGSSPPFDILYENAEIAIPMFKEIVERWSWYMQDFQPCLQNSHLATSWALAFGADKYKVETEPYSALFKIKVPDDFDGIFSSMRSKKRVEFKRLLKRTEEAGGFHMYQGEGSIEVELERMRTVIKKSWKNSSDMKNSGLAFLEDLARSLDNAGRLNLRFVMLDGQPVAYLMEIDDKNGGWHAYHNGYTGGAKHSPGLVLLMAASREAVLQKKNTYYFWGNKDYTRRLANGEEHAVILRISRKSLSARAALSFKSVLSRN